MACSRELAKTESDFWNALGVTGDDTNSQSVSMTLSRFDAALWAWGTSNQNFSSADRNRSLAIWKAAGRLLDVNASCAALQRLAANS